MGAMPESTSDASVILMLGKDFDIYKKKSHWLKLVTG
jgi:hypothetical protein